jgi:hypothetical protein
MGPRYFKLSVDGGRMNYQAECAIRGRIFKCLGHRFEYK